MIKLVATDMDGTFLDGEGRFDMERLKNVLVSYKEKGIYFAVASGRGILSLKKLFADVRDEVIFIAENGSYVEFHGEDMYEATMSRDFYLSTFEALKKSPYFDERKMLLTGKKACYVLDTVDETYLMFSRHYNENIQKVASLEDITDEIFKFTTNFTEETIEVGEAWVNENVPGVKAMTTGFESIDIVLAIKKTRTHKFRCHHPPHHFTHFLITMIFQFVQQDVYKRQALYMACRNLFYMTLFDFIPWNRIPTY